MSIPSRRSSLIFGALCALVGVTLATAGSAFGASVADGEFVPDDRFGDYSVIHLAGDSAGSAATVRQIGERTWRVHDRSPVEGTGLCSKALDARTVVCKTPTPPDLSIVMGSGRDSVSVVGSGVWEVHVDLGPGNDEIDLGELKRPLFVFVWGGPGDDRLAGSGIVDYLFGRQGDDEIRGRGDEDEIHGNEGRDRLYGGGQKDQIDSGLDRVQDQIKCGRGWDRARFGPGDVFPWDDCEKRTPDAGSLIPDRGR